MSEYPNPIPEPRRLRERIRRGRSAPSQPPSQAAPFAQREIACEDEESARAEAERQGALESDPEAEWIYLKPEGSGEWVARRTPRYPKTTEAKGSLWEGLLEALLP